MAPHSSTLAWKIIWTEEPGGLQSMGRWESDRTERLHFHFSLSCIGEGNGNPLQCSCLESPRDGGAWWAAIYGVAQSRTWLKRFSSSSSSRYRYKIPSVVDQIRSVAQSCPTLCDPMNHSTPGLPVHHQLPEFTQTHVHWVSDAIQPSHPLSSPSPLALNPYQHQSFPMSQLFTWGGQSTGVSALASFLPKKSQGWSPSEWTGWISLLCRHRRA